MRRGAANPRARIALMRRNSARLLAEANTDNALTGDNIVAGVSHERFVEDPR